MLMHTNVRAFVIATINTAFDFVAIVMIIVVAIITLLGQIIDAIAPSTPEATSFVRTLAACS